MKQIFSILFCFGVFFSFSQYKPSNGLEESKPTKYVLKNATVITSSDKTIENGSILIEGEKILKIGTFLTFPDDAVVIDCDGKYIFPAFIELNSTTGIADLKKPEHSFAPQLDSKKEGAYYWNESIHPEVDAKQLYASNKKSQEELISKGFGYALTHQNDGIAQGSGAFVALIDDEKGLIESNPTSFYSFDKGISKQSYPSSQMGSIALLRQAYYDAMWYANHNESENLSLEALHAQLKYTLFFSSKDKLEIPRAAKIAKEFDLSYNYYGSGNEYAIVNQLKDLQGIVVLPLTFPSAYDVRNPYVSRQIPLSDLRDWELSPKNPYILASNGIQIAITSNGTKNAKEFWSNLRKAIQHGLTIEQALDALTTIPAKTIGAFDKLGTLEEGKTASFSIYEKNPFEEDAELHESWIMGERSLLKSSALHDLAGDYNILLNNHRYAISIKGDDGKYKGSVKYSFYDAAKSKNVDTTASVFVDLVKNDITLQFFLRDANYNGNISLRAKVNSKVGVFEGEGLLPDGTWIKWSGIRTKLDKPSNKPANPMEIDSTYNLWYPNMAYGFEQLPEEQVVVIKNATVWTNEEDGIIKDATVVIKNGKIDYVGTGSPSTPRGATVIDAHGKHVTSGIIDEHSHIAISKGVNESGQAITSEVSIGDVVNPDDINIYRQLAGGVTASQLLHGSANPIGGQSALIKLKWGFTADEMLIDNAPKFIKFALGENVKQSNWGQFNTVRFPQTRMGVEQVYYDAFYRAREYEALMKKYANNPEKQPRRDLELDVLVEILNGDRNITCHSYIQSEINMLMHVADSMGFKINTFTHILEGYKLADKMAEHGAGGSTFSDWWAYKYEVNDAIPYNAKMMMDQGVVVAINSDDAEMGRRLNQEAAKGVKYGGMSEEDAWKMVTLNPAKLLHLDHRMGSLRKGKDADIVIWSANPLSINAIVEQTYVDGLLLYDKRTDAESRNNNNAERARIISKMLAENNAGYPYRSFIKKPKGAFHCNTIGEEESLEENHH